MSLTSKRTSLIILGITALVCSRTMLVSFNDPQGPNLLIVVVFAAAVYCVSLAAYAFNSPATSLKRFSLALLIQVLLVTVLYFLLR